MFFAVPKVKSLSRYSEYGIYMGSGSFLSMLLAAMLIHAGIIVIYSLAPHQQVVRIPVHALNIKLSGGGSSANGVHLPDPAATPAVAPQKTATEKEDDSTLEVEMKPVPIENPETAMDKALKLPKAPPHATKNNVTVPGGTGKVVREAKKNSRPAEVTFAMPKKYVREDTHSAAKNHTPGGDIKGNGGGVGGDAGGTEVINRYTQTVSQWIKNHQSYARAAYKEAVQVQGRLVGQAVIRLRIDRDGHIVRSAVDRTSGNELIDEIAIAMVRASDPVPAVPKDYPSDSQLEFLIAVQVDFAKQ